MHAHSARIVLKEYEPTFTERRTTDIHIHNYIYEKSAIRLTSVGLAHARPNISSAERRFLFKRKKIMQGGLYGDEGNGDIDRPVQLCAPFAPRNGLDF